jgi:DedD protein
MQKSPDGQYEVVLENRQVLTIFFAVVVLCGVFFGLGYTVGKNTVGYIPPVEASQGPASGKKSAMQPVSGSEAKQEALPQPSQLTYDKSLDEKATVAKLEPAPAAATSAAIQPAAVQPAAAAPPAATVPAEGRITLQIAALSKKDDADSLLGLLTRKGIRAHLVSTSADKLYRVQVGPFATMKDADEMKSRLEQEGFKPIKK